MTTGFTAALLPFLLVSAPGGSSLRVVRILRLLLGLFATAVMSQAGPEAEILKAYDAARPADHELGVFRLDWADSFNDAKTRAAREKRPIFLVCTTQLKDAGNLRDGHC